MDLKLINKLNELYGVGHGFKLINELNELYGVGHRFKITK